LEHLKNHLPLHDNQRLVSAAGKFAGVWLSIVPTSLDLQLSDQQMYIASRLRLGLPPLDHLPERCVCGATLSEDNGHFLSCENLRRSAVTARHDSIVRVLAKFLRRATALVHEEPRFYNTTKLRPDLDVVFPDEYLMVDVVVTHPAAPSRKTIYPLAAAEEWERRKVNKYSKHAAIRGATMLAFSLESYGAWSSQALKVAKIIKKQCEGNVISASPKEIYLATIQCVSLAIQKGNSLVITTSGAKQSKFGKLMKSQVKKKRSSSAQTLPVDIATSFPDARQSEAVQ